MKSNIANQFGGRCVSKSVTASIPRFRFITLSPRYNLTDWPAGWLTRFQILSGVDAARFICHATCAGLHKPSVLKLTVFTTFSSSQNSRSVIAPLRSGMPAPTRASILVQWTIFVVAVWRLFQSPASVLRLLAVRLMSNLIGDGFKDFFKGYILDQ